MTKPDRKTTSDQDIYDRIFAAVLDRRLRPGAHLREVELAQSFGVSRTKVRQALAKLIELGIVEMRPNRGAAVAEPSRQQAREVFELRSMIEPAVAAALAQRRSAEQITRLRAHIALEHHAHAERDEAGLIRLTGEFHLLLAGMLDNALVLALLQKLEALTCLAMLNYVRPGASACLPGEHGEILDAIASGQSELARSSMATHLEHVRADLDLEVLPVPEQKLAVLLGLGGNATAAGPRSTGTMSAVTTRRTGGPVRLG
jgi:DNA-binding GntR family transcriptional regulator